MEEDSTGFFEKLRKYFSTTEPPAPKGPFYGLENKTPYSSELSRVGTDPHWGIRYSNNGYGPNPQPIGLRPDYWEKYAQYRGTEVLPENYDIRGRGFPTPVITRVPELIYPPDTPYGEVNTTRGYGAPFFINDMADKNRGVPNNIAPRLTEQRRVIRMNTPAEKAAYLASQNERGFQLVGDPYNNSKYIESRTQLGSAIPFADEFRAGQGMRGATAGSPYMTPAQALRYYPEYLKDPRTWSALAKEGGRAVSALAVATTPFDALDRRERYFTDFYNKNKRDPNFVEDAGMRLRAGIEPALNAGTFGAYDTVRNVEGIMDNTTNMQVKEFVKRTGRVPTEKEKSKMLDDQFEYSGFYM